IGGGSAIALFALAGLASRSFVGTAGGDQFAALFGVASIGGLGYLAVVAQAGLIALVTAATSRRTVTRTSETIHYLTWRQDRHRADEYCAMIARGGEEMPTVGHHADDGVAGMTGSTEGPAPRPLLRRLGWSTLVLCASVVLLVGLGFLWFIRQVPAEEVTLTRDADGIVALTGGASRIADAIELLASGRGKRLLISGAYRATNST